MTRVALERPLVVIAGFNDPGTAAPYFKRTFGSMATNPEWIVELTPRGETFDECRYELTSVVDRAIPSGDIRSTVEVDVVALSMGGLIARYAAAPDPGHPTRQLKIARLFTLCTPHRGAKMAWLPTWNALQIDMRKESKFLNALPKPDYPVIAYARLDDHIVGEQNAALEGENPIWVPNRPFEDAHLSCYDDPRLMADIARRLRGEKPYTIGPPAPLPDAD